MNEHDIRTCLAHAGRRRSEGLRCLRGANARIRELAPMARDEGLTVREIADICGLSRPGVYILVNGSGKQARE